jgi:hypothetical protein
MGFSRYGNNAFTVGHYDMFSLSGNPKAGLFEATDGSDMAYTGESGHYCLIFTKREILPLESSFAVFK